MGQSFFQTGITQQTVTADPGSGAAIPVTNSASINIVTGASGETNTLANPAFLGQLMEINLQTDGGGDRVITAAAAINRTGNTVMTFGDVGDYILLKGIYRGASLRWQVIANDGVALS